MSGRTASVKLFQRGMNGEGLRATLALYLVSIVSVAAVTSVPYLVLGFDGAFRLAPIVAALVVAGQYGAVHHRTLRKWTRAIGAPLRGRQPHTAAIQASDTREQSAREGVPHGLLYGLFALLAYVGALPVGLMLFWGAFPSTRAEWVAAISRSLVFFIGWAGGFVPVRTSWPIILAAPYVVLPDPLLGPLDDIVVAGLGSVLQLWLWARQAMVKRQDARRR